MRILIPLIFYLIVNIFSHLVYCLYEDQIGKFDWRHQFVGRLDHVLRSSDIWQDHQLLISSTYSGTVAGLHLRNGSINWRHLLDSPSKIDFLSSFPKSLSDDFSCPVLSINGHGRWIRCWKTSGVLISEHFLPKDFFKDMDKTNDYDVLFESIHDSQDPSFLVVKIIPSNYLFEFFKYHFKTRKLESIFKITAAKWLESSQCHMISSSYLICIDQKDREFQLVDLNEEKPKFMRVPLSTFGLTQEIPSVTSSSKLRIQSLPPMLLDKTTTISTANLRLSQYFVLNLGDGQGLILFKIVPELQNSTGASSIRLVKIIPYAISMTMIPLISSSQEPSTARNGDGFEFGAAVIFSKQQSIPYENPDDAEFQQKVFAIKLSIFHIESWSEVTSLSSKSILFEFGSKSSISPINSNGKLPKRLDDIWKIDKFEIIPIRSLIQNRGRDQYRYTYKMVITTEDGTVIVSNLMGKVNWAREEALAEINSLVMIDLPLSETDATLEQEYGFSERNSNIVSMFLIRIKSQIMQLTTYMRQLHQWLLHSFIKIPKQRNLKNGNQEDDDETLNLDQDELTNNFEYLDDDDEEALIRDYFGFHKIIIARTKTGKLFALDTLSSRIIWTRHESSLRSESNEAKFPIFIQRTNAHYPHSSVCTIMNELDKKTYLFSFDPVTGKVLDSLWLPYKTIQAMLLQTIQDAHFQRPLLLLDSEYKAHLYPDSDEVKKLFTGVASNHYMMIVNRSSALITGYSFSKFNAQQQESKANELWNFRLPHEPNKLISLSAVFKRPTEQIHSQGRVLGDRNVLYKYLNPNLVAVLCESLDTQEKSLITLYLIDSVNGNIIYSIVHRRARGPYQIVHSGNSVIYSYYNDKMRRNEISSLEVYEGFNQINSSAFSSIGRDLSAMLTVEQKTFIFPTGIGVMTDTETLKGITSKHILISLPTGGILELPRAFLDPRRPIRPTQEHAEEGLIPYVPELPIPSETMINYNQTVFAVREIITSPASLESTSLICVYGIDIYYTRVAPSKTFDILKDDFDHLLILAVLSMLIFMSFLARYLASKKSLNASWK